MRTAYVRIQRNLATRYPQAEALPNLAQQQRAFKPGSERKNRNDLKSRTTEDECYWAYTNHDPIKPCPYTTIVSDPQKACHMSSAIVSYFHTSKKQKAILGLQKEQCLADLANFQTPRPRPRPGQGLVT